jgi:murein DD-endopeptidase MepM/ murein hydrolase activator NlpD
MNKWKMKLKIRAFEFKEFLGDWGRLVYSWGYSGFAKFEVVKRGVAKILYRQRGRFAKPFMHAGVGSLVALAVTLAPVLASSMPGSQPVLDASGPGELTAIDPGEPGMLTEISDKVRDREVEYTVAPGDTVSAIAEKFGVSMDTIRWENKLVSVSSIKPGQKLRILPVSGVLHKVTRGETIYTIAKKYEANPQAVVDYPFNNFADNETFALAVGQELVVPDGKKPAEVLWSPSRNVAQNTPNAGAVSGTGQFVWPMAGRITQRFAWYHSGLDIATGYGTPVLAADSGTVVVAGWPDNSGYGIRVVIDHGNGYQTWYGHLSKVLVSAGQGVGRGQQIGLEGSTGRSTGPHLHFEIRRGSTRLNPLDLLK